jgi:hypothetical protein
LCCADIHIVLRWVISCSARPFRCQVPRGSYVCPKGQRTAYRIDAIPDGADMRDNQQTRDDSTPVQDAEHAERLVRTILDDMPVNSLRQLVAEMKEMIARHAAERA